VDSTTSLIKVDRRPNHIRDSPRLAVCWDKRLGDGIFGNVRWWLAYRYFKSLRRKNEVRRTIIYTIRSDS